MGVPTTHIIISKLSEMWVLRKPSPLVTPLGRLGAGAGSG